MTSPTIFEHTSGLRVIHQRRQQAPVVAAQVWVHVGSADEDDGERGLAHVHEHMIFKGTERFGVGEVAAEIERVGGKINAWTSFDETVYHIVVPSRFAEAGLDVLLDALQHSSFEADELERELEVIQEEILRGEDNPSRVLMQSMFSTVFQQHPYGLPVIGTSESVGAFRRSDVLEFYRKWYTPSNMTLVVVGDLTRDELERILDGAVTATARPQTTRPTRPPEPSQHELRTTFEYRDVQASQLSLVFPGPPLSGKDLPALEVLLTLLGGGTGSVLYERLRRELQIVESVYAGSYTPRDPGMIVFGASFEANLAQRDPMTVLRELLKEINLATIEPFTTEDVERAARTFEASVIHQQQTVEGQAQRFGHFDSVAGDISFDLQFLDRVRAVTPSDVLDVARRYFRMNRLTVGFMLPREAAERGYETSTVADIVDAASGQREQAQQLAQATADEYGIVRVDLPVDGYDSSLQLLIVPDDSVPVFSVRALALGGEMMEPTPASSLALSKLLTAGTTTWSAPELAKRADYLGLSLGGVAGNHSVGLQMTALTRDLAASLKMFESCLFDATLPESEFERVRRELRRMIERRRDNLSGSAIHAFREAIYGDHPYARPSAGELEDVDALELGVLRDWMQRQIQPQRLVVGVVGDVDVAEIVAIVRRWAARPSTIAAIDYSPVPCSPQYPGPRRFAETRDRKQAHVVLGYPGVSSDDEDVHALYLLAAVLGAQGGRLFRDLRDTQSLAYSVTAWSSSSQMGGDVGGYIGTSADKIDAAIDGLRGHFEAIASDGVREEELERARRLRIGARDVSSQRRSARAAELVSDVLFGFGQGYSERYAERLERVTTADIQRVAQRVVRADGEVVSLIHPDEA